MVVKGRRRGRVTAALDLQSDSNPRDEAFGPSAICAAPIVDRADHGRANATLTRRWAGYKIWWADVLLMRGATRDCFKMLPDVNR